MSKAPVHIILLARTQTVKSQDTVKILGMLDSKMSLDQQISNISRMHIRNLESKIGELFGCLLETKVAEKPSGILE